MNDIVTSCSQKYVRLYSIKNQHWCFQKTTINVNHYTCSSAVLLQWICCIVFHFEADFDLENREEVIGIFEKTHKKTPKQNKKTKTKQKQTKIKKNILNSHTLSHVPGNEL